MARLRETDLKKQIDSGKFGNFYFIFGEEKLLIKHYKKLLIEKVLMESANSFNLHQFNFNEYNFEHLLESLESLPFFNSRKCVVLKDFDINKINATELKQLKEAIKDLPQTTVFIIVLETLEENEKTSAKLKAFLKAAEPQIQILELKKLGKVALENQLINWCKKRGCELSLNNASEILKKGYNDLLSLQNEIEKLTNFANNREIKKEDIDLLVIKNLEANVFDLAGDIFNKEYDLAFLKINDLIEKKEDPIMILAILSAAFVDVFRVKLEPDIEALKESFDYKRKEFRLNIASKYSKILTLEFLERAIEILANTELSMKSSKMDSRFLLEKMISNIKLIERL